MDLNKILSDLKEKNYYEVLGVERDVTRIGLRRARTSMLVNYHPDKFQGEDKGIAVSIASTINIAFEALSDADFRKKYDESDYQLIYSVGGNHVTAKPKAKNLSNEKTKGRTATGIAKVPFDVLVNGGKVTVSITAMADVDLPKSIEINLPKGTKNNSTLIFEGLGEKSSKGANGDIIVLIYTTDKIENELDEKLTGIHEKFVTIFLEDGEIENLVLSETFDIKIPQKTNLEKDSLLIIKDIGIKGTSLIIES